MRRAAKSLRDAVRARHSCNAWCRDGRHAQVVWHASPDTAVVEKSGRVLCGMLGWRLLRLEAASPETKRPPTLQTLSHDGKTVETYGDEPLHGYLLTWEGA